MWELRLGDEIDDYCVKCRRLTNHSVVSLVDGKAAKVRCRSCYSDHDYRNEQPPPNKKALAKQKDLFNAVLGGVAPPEIEMAAGLKVSAQEETEVPAAEALASAKPKGRAKKKKP